MGMTALITGASGGIGYALARIHAENGGDLIVVARTKEKLERIKEEFESLYGIRVFFICKDLSQPGIAEKVLGDIRKLGVSVDYLINNAGIGDVGLFAESDWKRQEMMINLNITALVHLTRLLLPDMIERGSGKIMNLASTASFQPGPTMSVYFATKAFVLSFSEALNNEVAGSGITVTALCPGSTDTGFHQVASGEGRRYRDRELPPPERIALFGYRAMLKGIPVAVPGFRNRILALLVRFFPRRLVVGAVRKIQEGKFPPVRESSSGQESSVV
jgi:uncharacterized protein